MSTRSPASCRTPTRALGYALTVVLAGCGSVSPTDSRSLPGAPSVPAVAPPVISPPAGTFTDSVTFTLVAADPGAEIHYSTVPGLERGAWPRYDGPVTVPPLVMSGPWETRVWAVASIGGVDSPVVEAAYTVGYSVDPTPTFSPPGGPLTGPVDVVLHSAAPAVAIIYTTDGSSLRDWPDSAMAYGGPVRVDRTMTIEAMACNPRACSAPVQARYTF